MKSLFILLSCFVLVSRVSALDHKELLYRFRPHLFATNKEFSPPIAVEDMLAHSYLIDMEKHEVVCGDDYMALQLSIDILRQYDDERYCVKLMRDYTRLFGKNRRENYANARPVVYGRATDIPDARAIALQYFFFYPGSYSGRLPVGIQIKWHEGDTEYAQILVDSKTLEPLGASSSIHYYGTSYPWRKLLKADDGRLKIYIAQLSHATYFFPSKFPGHQAMEGNLGFGGNLLISLRTVWDYTHEDREVNYELRCPPEDHPVFSWKGRWGGKELLYAHDNSSKAHELGPVSFAYRNAMSEKLSMWNDPEGFFCFYYLPSDFYQKTLMALKEVKDPVVLDSIFDIVLKMGRLRIQVDHSLRTTFAGLDDKQKIILAEAVPYVVLSVAHQGPLDVYNLGADKMGRAAFENLMRKIAARNIKLILKSMTTHGIDVGDIIKDPLNLYKIRPERLLALLSALTGLDKKTVTGIYETSHRFRHEQAQNFSAFHILHAQDNY